MPCRRKRVRVKAHRRKGTKGVRAHSRKIAIVKRSGWPTGMLTHKKKYYVWIHKEPLSKEAAIRKAKRNPNSIIAKHSGLGYFVYRRNTLID